MERDVLGRTVLHRACIAGNLEELEAFLLSMSALSTKFLYFGLLLTPPPKIDDLFGSCLCFPCGEGKAYKIEI